MTLVDIHRNQLIVLALAVLMASTRMYHFGAGTILPDASIAVFFLAGRYLKSPPWFAALFVEAAALDQLAFTLGVSDWCFTPAYVALIPAYGAMFFAGRITSDQAMRHPTEVATLALALAAAVLVFFGVSNVGFWAGSGYFPNMSLGTYMAEVQQYLPPYLATGFAYVGAGLVAETLLVRSRPAGALR